VLRAPAADQPVGNGRAQIRWSIDPNRRRVRWLRQIYLDGRSLPVDPAPTFNGYSTGRWEGDALVVQSNGLRDGTWLDRNGSPLTDPPS
jgi:hypothetical protein